jgi:SAM-dependent methyltransferase
MEKEMKYYDNKRDDLVRLIPETAHRILDVGCGIGTTGQYIKKIRGGVVEVIGVEIDPVAGEIAKSNIDKVIIGDIEKIRLSFEKEYFDCIIYGDVLEHLVDPWTILKEHGNFLKHGGHVIASIPNIAHYRVVKMLKKQRWDYQDSGILDKQHIRFFTLKSIKDMFGESGLKIIKVDYKIGASDIKKILNRIFFNFYLHSITEQYIVVAQK